jgi:putative flippase GtrA
MIIDRSFWRFILVGVVNTLVGTGIMFGLYNIVGCGYWFSSAMNYFLTSILSFFLNKYFTFEAKNWSLFMVLAFILTIMVAYLMAYGIAKPLASWILKNKTEKIRDNVSLFVGMCLFTGLNYLGQRFIAFRKT